MNAQLLRRLSTSMVVVASLMLAACATQSGGSSKGWKTADLATALATLSRPQADRDRDADRKPAQLMTILGFKPGMTVVDMVAAGGYMTEVLSITVGPTGKVYMQNPAAMLQSRNGVLGNAVTTRLANNRLQNVTRVDGELSASGVPPNSVDGAITALNFHDVYMNGGMEAGQAFMKQVYGVLKPGGFFAVIDHASNDPPENPKMHRVPKRVAIEAAKAAGFVLDSESNVLANPADDHTKPPTEPSLRGKTDQFVLKFKKPPSK